MKNNFYHKFYRVKIKSTKNILDKETWHGSFYESMHFFITMDKFTKYLKQYYDYDTFK